MKTLINMLSKYNYVDPVINEVISCCMIKLH